MLEALVALSVAAVGLSAIGALAHSTHAAGLMVERRVALAATARKIEAAMPSRAELKPGALSGTLDSHAWTLTDSPWDVITPASGSTTVWRPQRVRLQVRGPYGDAVEIETVRLIRQPQR